MTKDAKQLEADARIQESMRKRHVLVTVTHEESAARVSDAPAGLCTCWLLMYQLVDDDEEGTSGGATKSSDEHLPRHWTNSRKNKNQLIV
ncbi:hypothetical protein F511_28222 [Dorcoceras hygrometricum]|uniref:Uncharacterized protein n=1 Tax=Dorcoceras hygrometricum TaxID=472368 RepID=A0A2Z7C596_9LAMI|nr:hypothetical protein F511_28222 [Dorcoceras hygrometricum]